MSRSSWKNVDGNTRRRNITASQFSSRPVDLLRSPALRVLSAHEHLALARIELELRQHGGHGNGQLIVTTQQFIEYGIERRQIPGALRALEALAIVVITERGLGGNAEHRRPNRFLLNYLCGAVDAHDQVTNSWKRFQTLGEAEKVAAAGLEPPRTPLGSPTAAGFPASQKYFPGTKNAFSRYQNCTRKRRIPRYQSVLTGPGTRPVPTIDISGGGGGQGGKFQKNTGPAAPPS